MTDAPLPARVRLFLKGLTPPFLWQALKALKDRVRTRAEPVSNSLLQAWEETVPAPEARPEAPAEWEYVPEGWARRDADAAVKGWDVEAIVEAYRRRWPSYLRALEGPAPLAIAHEVTADEVATDDVAAHNTLVSYAYVLALAARGRERVSLLDWGGGIGHYYPLSRAVLPGVEIDYHCKDVPTLCEHGRELFPEARFCSDDESCLDRAYDLVLASGSLQYSEQWQETLRRLAGVADRFLYVTRLPVALAADSFVVVQRPYAYGYETEYLGWVVSRRELLEAAADAELEFVREFLLAAWFSARGAPEDPIGHRGFLFKPRRTREKKAVQSEGHVAARAAGARDRAGSAGGAALTVCAMTAGPAARLAAILTLLRPVADEILIAVDDRAEPSVVSALGRVADRLILYPYAEPVDRPLPWLHTEAQGDWVLSLDDDEIPSARLLDALPALLRADDVTHYWLPRRWLFPDAAHHLDEPPWRPDYQLRLVRNDPRFLRFSAEFHRPIVVHGPGRFPDMPIWHADPILRPRELREQKARKYEQLRPGMRIAGRALNFAFYVPELRPSARTARLPGDERRLVEAVLGAQEATEFQPFPARLARVTRGEIDRHWPGREFGERAYRAELDVVEPPAPMTAGERRAFDVLVTNLGDEDWEWGVDGEPAVRLASRWRLGSGNIVGEPLRTHLPARVPAGANEIVPVHAVAPAEPGRYRLEIDLVHEHVRWFGVETGCTVDVLVPRRNGDVGGPADVARVAELLAELPELEPVVGEPVGAQDGYAELAGLRPYLLGGTEAHQRSQLAVVLAARTSALVLAARKLGANASSRPLPRGGHEFLADLGACEALVVAGLGGPPDAPPTRELWRLAATVRASRALGVPVLLAEEALGGAVADGIDARLAGVVRRSAEQRFGDLLELVQFLREPLREPAPRPAAP